MAVSRQQSNTKHLRRFPEGAHAEGADLRISGRRRFHQGPASEIRETRRAASGSTIKVVGFPHFGEGEVKEDMMAIDVEYSEVVGLGEVAHDH